MYKYDRVRQRAMELRKDNPMSKTIHILRTEFSADELPTEDRVIRRWFEKKPIKSQNSDKEFHNNELAKIAEQLIANGLDKVEASQDRKPPYDIFKYIDWERGGIGITAEQFSSMIRENLATAELIYDDWGVYEMFLPHLTVEFPLLAQNSLNHCIENYPLALIETLRLLAHKRTFNGTCPVCKDF